MKLHRETQEEKEARKARVEAEKALRETAERWPAVREVSDALAEVRRDEMDPFLAELARAMEPKHTRREA
jgi:hypothetical protein